MFLLFFKQSVKWMKACHKEKITIMSVTQTCMGFRYPKEMQELKLEFAQKSLSCRCLGFNQSYDSPAGVGLTNMPTWVMSPTCLYQWDLAVCLEISEAWRGRGSPHNNCWFTALTAWFPSAAVSVCERWNQPWEKCYWELGMHPADWVCGEVVKQWPGECRTQYHY